LTPTSKALISYLAGCGAPQIAVTAPGARNDPARSVLEHVNADPSWLARKLSEALAGRPSRGKAWSARWRELNANAAVVIDAHLAALDHLSGNRGVNGIDGVISSALGAGAASGRRVVLVLGDLSFYHDMNGLLAAKLHRLDATIIVLNNDGGGIFHFLPQAEHRYSLEPYFAMPTGLDLRPVVEMYGGHFHRPQSWEELRYDLIDSWTEPGLTVVEVRTDRDRNVKDHRMLWEAVGRSQEEQSQIGA
jgi:2-succinyl-5-enolpyruvyl-6-hydroxy-3-cyclohexene-1-carboxylate synthase